MFSDVNLQEFAFSFLFFAIMPSHCFCLVNEQLFYSNFNLFHSITRSSQLFSVKQIFICKFLLPFFRKKWTEKFTNFLSKLSIILVEWRENHRRSNNKNRESNEKEFQTNEYLYAPPFTHRPLLQNFHTSIIILYA